jgi:ABC-2 type transport system permease protein
MRKVLVVAAREYKAAVQTKTFLIGLLMMPILMGGSIVVQYLLRGVVDTSDRRYAVIDRTAQKGKPYLKAIEEKVATHNAATIEGGKQVRPRFVLEDVPPGGSTEREMEDRRVELSERVRQGQLIGFFELLPPRLVKDKSPDGKGPPPVTVRYQSNRVMDRELPQMVKDAVAGKFRKEMTANKLSEQQLAELLEPARLDTRGLSEKDATGRAREASEQSRVASVAAPMGLMILMFMVVLMGSTPLMQGVVEEKMQRIAEVLLGSVPPFELMLGKLLGMAGVALTISAVYLSGALWAAQQFGFAEALSPGLLVWFVLYQALASLMFGSLFIAVGAACTDLKETQNLLWPVMLLACLPMFVLGSVLTEPNSPVAVGLSFFPFATPMLMVTRMAVPPGIPWWEPVLGIVVVLATTMLCVWAAGRIFRVGILMQGKGAKLGEMVRWVLRG